MSLIELDRVSRFFVSKDGIVDALCDVSLTIQSGEMIAIVGSSGSGKSTLLNLIGGLDRPNQGDVKIEGVTTSTFTTEQLSALRGRQIGFVFQRYHLIPYLTALENVVVPTSYTAQPIEDCLKRAKELLGRLGLGDRLNARPSELSGGQQQRVSVARALINGANIILADEPTGALDDISAQEVMDILHMLHRNGHTVIIVTHDHQVAKHAKRVIELSAGRIISDYANSHPCIAFTKKQAEPPQLSLGRPTRWMNFKNTAATASRCIIAYRMRALLAVLGVVVGISAVASSMAVGEGTRQQVLDEISNLGTNVIHVRPGQGWGMPLSSEQTPLTQKDVMQLKQLSIVESVSPVVSSSRQITRNAHMVDASLNGVSADYFAAMALDFTLGTAFTALNGSERQAVAVLSQDLSDALFDTEKAVLGATIQIGNVPTKVIGVTAVQENLGNLQAWIPYETFWARFSPTNSLDSVVVLAKPEIPAERAQTMIETALKRAHGKQDFFTESNLLLAKSIANASDLMSMMITSIAGISLLVAGVGVMNIMLIAVRERTSEIGIRMSFGALPSDIARHFLCEATIICLLGGVLGLAVSAIAGLVLPWISQEYAMPFSWRPVILSCSISTTLGIVFGVLPAHRAARLLPTEALARE